MSEKERKIQELAEKLCDEYCKHPALISDEDELDEICMKCPLNEVFNMMLKDCADCTHYNTDRSDPPCCSCVDKINFEKVKDND